MLNLSAVKSLSDIPEAIRPLFSLSETGELSLDDSKVKSQSDIDNILEAKRKEVESHNLTKAELAKYRRLDASPDALEKRIQELEATSGSASEQSERLKKALLDLRAKEKEASSLSDRLSKMEPEFEKLKLAQTKVKIAELVDEELKGHKDIDTDRTRRVLLKDVNMGYIGLDDTGTVLQLKDGGKLGEYIDQTAKDFGFLVRNTPGVTTGASGAGNRASNDGHKQFSLESENFLDDAAMAQANL